MNSKTPVFILAGGLGTRLSEENSPKPKPMVEVGGIPILIHIMRSYYFHGFNDFVICAGYRSREIKKFFLDYEFQMNHLSIDHRNSLSSPPTSLSQNHAQERWRVRVIDTGEKTQTGGRIARAFDEVSKLEKFDHFAVTYGDGVSSINLSEELKYHISHGDIGTVLGVHPAARFGDLKINSNGKVEAFLEKHQNQQDLINGGFFFFKSEFRSYLNTEDACILERVPLATLAANSQLRCFKYEGFWHPMDTPRDRQYLEGLWSGNQAPWLNKK